jgi:hypothetical protein
LAIGPPAFETSPVALDQTHLSRVRFHLLLRHHRPDQIVVVGIELPDELVQLQRRLPDLKQQITARAPAFDAALALDGGIIPLMPGAAALEFAGADLQG